MIKTIGTVLTVVGLLAALYFGYEAYQQQESLNVLGKEITVKEQGSYTPVLGAVGAMVLGIILMAVGKKK